jgi:hypothetical protein
VHSALPGSGVLTDVYGPSQGPGYWIFGGNCYGHGTVTNYGWYDG